MSLCRVDEKYDPKRYVVYSWNRALQNPESGSFYGAKFPSPYDYTYQLDVKGAGDTAVPVTTYTSGVVDGVLFKDGAIHLRLGTLEVALNDVSELDPGPKGTGNVTTTAGGALRALSGAALRFALPAL